MMAPAAGAATLPSGFAETQVASGLDPTAMEVLPDGRLLVCEKVGRLRVVKNDALLAAPVLDISGNVDNYNERGLDGVTCDPAFASNHRIYVYYTALTPAKHNRVSRFTMNGDVAAASRGLRLDDLSSAGNHNGGALHFGPDGKLYVTVGNNANAANDQSLANVLGKVLRLNSDGSIPSDNPFIAETSGRNQAIWALGLRNPFTAAFQPGTGRYFINDVGESSWEEVDLGVAGANYGFTGGATDGVRHDSRYRDPVFTYAHGSGDTHGSAITGGTFYNPAQRDASRRPTSASTSSATTPTAGSASSTRRRCAATPPTRARPRSSRAASPTRSTSARRPMARCGTWRAVAARPPSQHLVVERAAWCASPTPAARRRASRRSRSRSPPAWVARCRSRWALRARHR